MKFLTIFALIGICALPLSAQTEDPLAAAKSLYSSAAYKEALAALDAVPDSAAADQADKYRALCLLALNRTDDATHAIERLIERRPLFQLDPGDSPKLVALFTGARARVLPSAATALYESAKTAMDRGDLAKAAEDFGTVVKLVSQPEVADQPSIADLKVLADGFAKLANQQLALERRMAAAAPASKPAAAAATTPEPERVYSDQDRGVVPPEAISQVFPRWSPPNGNFRLFAFSGELEVVIDERGAVSAARMLKEMLPGYEQALLSSAKTWRYRPATRDGKPVKYRKVIRINLLPGSGGSDVSQSDPGGV